jgi:hypothetical protein
MKVCSYGGRWREREGGKSCPATPLIDGEQIPDLNRFPDDRASDQSSKKRDRAGYATFTISSVIL